jgi:hypothetical protein
MLKEINRLLRSTFDPTKLAYIHYPVYHIFDTIKKEYSKPTSDKIFSCFLKMAFNEDEQRRFEFGRFLTVNQFMLAKMEDPEEKPNNGEYIVEVRVKEYGDNSHGFY